MEQPAADFDGAWKYALEHYMPACLHLFFPQVYAGIDWDKTFIFCDKELEQINPEINTGKLRVDKLIRVSRHDGQPVIVFVHMEIQAQYDADFAKRMYRYHTRLFDRQDAPVVSLAVLADDDLHWHPDSFAYDLWGCGMLLCFPTVKLEELDAQMLEASANPIATMTLIHRDAQATRNDPDERMRRKVARFRTCLRQGYAAEDLRHLYRLLDQLMRLPPSIDEPARATMHQIEQEERGMTTFVTSFERLARAEAERDMVLRQLRRKLGVLSEPLEAEVAALSSALLVPLSEALLDFTTQADLEVWLRGQQDDASDE